jgi:hypothetical protein
VPPELKRWRPSDEFVTALEGCINTLGGFAEENRATICRKALVSYCRNQFEYTSTDKKAEAKNRTEGEKAHDAINLEINHNLKYIENKLGIKISEPELEGIVIAWIDEKLASRPEYKKPVYVFDDSY